MTPGLAFFYGGLVSRKSVITIMSQSFFSMGWVAIIRCAVKPRPSGRGYKARFFN
ncbi:hypothetical protein [Providencia manganoxydans]|uniref:hypothetical protein n=1 Tax=Providencia manganoxydans TaxID=2923283 RepID=UPI0034DD781D